MAAVDDIGASRFYIFHLNFRFPKEVVAKALRCGFAQPSQHLGRVAVVDIVIDGTGDGLPEVVHDGIGVPAWTDAFIVEVVTGMASGADPMRVYYHTVTADGGVVRSDSTTASWPKILVAEALLGAGTRVKQGLPILLLWVVILSFARGGDTRRSNRYSPHAALQGATER